jgi:transposase
VTGTMTWAAMDVHARSTTAAAIDVQTGKLQRRRFDTGRVDPVVDWLTALPAPVHACYEAGLDRVWAVSRGDGRRGAL